MPNNCQIWWKFDIVITKTILLVFLRHGVLHILTRNAPVLPAAIETLKIFTGEKAPDLCLPGWEGNGRKRKAIKGFLPQKEEEGRERRDEEQEEGEGKGMATGEEKGKRHGNFAPRPLWDKRKTPLLLVYVSII